MLLLIKQAKQEIMAKSGSGQQRNIFAAANAALELFQ